MMPALCSFTPAACEDTQPQRSFGGREGLAKAGNRAHILVMLGWDGTIIGAPTLTRAAALPAAGQGERPWP